MPERAKKSRERDVKPFFFGAATSAHQVEGDNHNDWTEWEKKNAERLADARRNIRSVTRGAKRDYISGRAADHYHRFEEDFDIARSLGHTAHRFSIEWSRVEPREGEFNEREIDHYREVVAALRERGIEPFITLWHWTMPVWLTDKGGVLAKDFPRYFGRFAEKVARALKDDVRFWITLNEPEVFTSQAYYHGNRPPQRRGGVRLVLGVFRRLMAAHDAAYAAIKKVARAAGREGETQAGIVIDMVYFDTVGGIANHVLVWLANHLWNLYFLNRVRRRLDFIGVNYYFHQRVHYGLGHNKNERISDMGWEIYPEGIYHILKSLAKYHLPIYVTENGVADARDAHRAEFVREHLYWIKKQ